MPNWCENLLTISGPNEEVVEFVNSIQGVLGEKEKAKKLLIDFRVHAPISEPGTLDEAVSTWGTKWLIDSDDGSDWDVNEDGSAAYATLGFLSAWAPPLLWMKKVGQLYPSLTFAINYEEPGNCFRGEMILTDGNIFLQNEEFFSWDEEDI